jgi:hypothetical protein
VHLDKKPKINEEKFNPQNTLVDFQKKILKNLIIKLENFSSLLT